MPLFSSASWSGSTRSRRGTLVSEASWSVPSRKSEYDYKGTAVGRDAAARRLQDTERFLAAVREILG
jgi:hypothetical protein